MINVLITSFGSNTSIGVAKCLKDDGCFIIGTDSNPFYECNGYKFANIIEQLPYYNDPLYEEELLRIVKDYSVSCIIPIHDKEIEVISKMKDNGRFENVNVSVNQFSIVKLCNDKIQINELLKEIIYVPKVYTELSEDINFPIIIKDNDGVSSKDIKVIVNEDDFKENDFTNKIIQEYINGEEYTVDCFSSYCDDNLFYYSVRKRIETKSGMSVKSVIVENSTIGECCKKIHETLGYKGVSNIQFIVKNDIPYFIEINPRFAGGEILTYKSGYNFPLMTIDELCNNKIDSEAKLQIGNKMVRYYEETFFNESNDCIRL